jgi:hypothetical protein
MILKFFFFYYFFMLCRSFWVKRDVGNLNQFIVNIGTTPGVNTMMTAGYRSTNTFTFA